MRSCSDIMRSRIILQVCLVVAFFGYLIFTLYRVQIKRHAEYHAEARKKYITSVKTQGKRGEIFDSSGSLLVGNMPRQNVFITPCNIKSKDDATVARILADELHLDYDKVLAKVSRKTWMGKNKAGVREEMPLQYAQITTNITLEEARHLRKVLQKAKLSRNVHFENTYVRYYPKGKFLSNVLGLTTLNSGVMGVEQLLEDSLKSDEGSKTYMRTPDGNQVGDKPLKEKNSHDGLNIYLTINEPLQSILEEELEKACEYWRPAAAYAVMIEPSTGNVLAMAERPSFDPNNRKDVPPSLFRVRLVNEVFEPGSIMKPLTVAGALHYQVVTPDTKIDCLKGMMVFRRSTITDTHGYGIQDITGVIRKSSNIGTAKIAIMMGEQKLYRTLCKFGLGTLTGISLPSEKRGVLKPPAQWDGLSISRFGYGYGVNCTPVQMARAYCALANRGKLPKLRLIDRTVDAETGASAPSEQEPLRTIFSPEVGEEIVKMMIAVTEKGGTATQAAIPGYHVAGKTGTAYRHVPGKGYDHKKRFTSFAGFVPAEKPAFVLLVTLDSAVHPKGYKTYGGAVSGPVWKAIAERALKYLNIPPNVPVEDKSKKNHLQR